MFDNNGQDQSMNNVSLPSSSGAPANDQNLTMGDPIPTIQPDHTGASLSPAADPAPVPAPSTDKSSDLIDIKKKALDLLGPLVNHLDQAPEEKFRTTMMMIQASDDQSLIPKAYEAAQAITDEKEKAQALLDIINEINYFNQKDQS